jgi:hypothetical protein
VHTNKDAVFSVLLTITLNCFTLETGDPDRMVINPDLLGEGVKIVQGGVLINKFFNFFS